MVVWDLFVQFTVHIFFVWQFFLLCFQLQHLMAGSTVRSLSEQEVSSKNDFLVFVSVASLKQILFVSHFF